MCVHMYMYMYKLTYMTLCIQLCRFVIVSASMTTGYLEIILHLPHLCPPPPPPTHTHTWLPFTSLPSSPSMLAVTMPQKTRKFSHESIQGWSVAEVKMWLISVSPSCTLFTPLHRSSDVQFNQVMHVCNTLKVCSLSSLSPAYQLHQLSTSVSHRLDSALYQ